MKYMSHRNFRVVLSTLLILGLVLFPNTAKAETETSPSFIEPTYAGSVNGEERSLIFSKNEAGEIVAYFKVGDEEPVRFGRNIDTGFDCYGAIWAVDKEAGWIAWWSYELAGGDTSKISNFTLLADPENPMDFLQEVDCLVYEGEGRKAVVIGYKDTSGKTHSLLSFEEMREIDGSGSTVPEPSYVPWVETPPVETPLPSSEPDESVLKKYTGSVDGVERSLFLTDEVADEITLLLKIGDLSPDFIDSSSDFVDAGIDEYGAVEILRKDGSIIWWSYDLAPDLSRKKFYLVPNACDPEGYMHDIETFIFEGEGEQAIVVGYKSTSGSVYSVPSFSEMKAYAEIDSPLEPVYVPKGVSPKPTGVPATAAPTAEPNETLAPETAAPTVQPNETLAPETAAPTVQPNETLAPETATPTAQPNETLAPETTTPTAQPNETLAPETATPTAEPSATATPPSALVPTTQASVPATLLPTISEPTVTPQTKLVIKNSKKKGVTTRSLCERNKVIIEYSLKKGKLNWKTNKKKGSMKNVKYVVFIEKSRNLYVGDKKGRGYIISSKTGKKKLIIKKGAKKPICSGRFGIKVKTASGRSISIKNK